MKRINQERLHNAYNYAWALPTPNKRNYARKHVDHRAFDNPAPNEAEYGVEGQDGQTIRGAIDTILDGEKK